MTQERYNELNEEYKKLPDTDEAFEKWSKALGKEYDEWNDLDTEVENYIDIKIFEYHLGQTLAFGPVFGFDPKKIQPLLNDFDFAKFAHSLFVSGSLHIERDEYWQRGEWINEFFKMKGEKK